MGYDIGEWTVRVLEGGLPPMPEEVDLGQTVAVARWRGERFGAVLFVRRWRNGDWDSDCAITERHPRGEGWLEPRSWGGGPWWQGGFERPEQGWDGDPILFLGASSVRHEDPHDLGSALAIYGMAAPHVACIRVRFGSLNIAMRVESASGAFVIGVEGLSAHRDTTRAGHGRVPFSYAPGPEALVSAEGSDGRTLSDGRGRLAITSYAWPP